MQKHPERMIELKVHCDCGQKYKFDVEPVNGQMPFSVACPICQADGTAKANALLQQMAVFKMVGPPSAPASAPAPIAPIASPPVPSKLRLNISAPAGPLVAAPTAPPPIAPVVAAGTSPPSFAGMPRLVSAPAAEQSGRQPSFSLGILGGFLGALVGGIIYYLIYNFTRVHIGYMAIGVGALAGWGANLLSKGEGSKELAGITIVCFIMAVIGAQYLVARGEWNKAVRTYQDAGYTEMLTEAKDAVKAIPTGSDGEIRLYLARQNVEEGEAIKPNSVSDDDVKEFRDKELPHYQDLASGKETKEQYLARLGLDPAKMKKFQDENESTFKGVFLLIMLSRAGIISLVVGAGTAYKLCANA